MTTTLRPAGPERCGPDGSRSRDFTVCVNGRPVGGVSLAAEAGGEPGRIEALAIDAPDRRRGRGTVAALAAEEVLRGWGCRRVVVSVPEAPEAPEAPGSSGAAGSAEEPQGPEGPRVSAASGPGAAGDGGRERGSGEPQAAPYGLRIALSLGYTETNRTLHKDLAALPAGPGPKAPPGARLRELSVADAEQWLARQRTGFTAALTAVGVPAAQARSHTDASYAAALPHSTLLALDAGGGTAGRIWFTVTPPSGWIQAVEVEPPQRSRGFGRALMRAAEARCRTAGVTCLGLNVFTTNHIALALYASLGYRVRLRQLWKSLG